MSEIDMYDSSVRSARDFGVVFEYADDVGYFYLMEMSKPSGRRIIAAIKVVEGMPGFEQADVTVRWNRVESWAGLLIRGELWAAFEPTHALQVGGDYHPGGNPELPPNLAETFIRK